ncbi:MAG TPA: HNH endonuclease signature motif containing protein [Streptosporangiaceae bacterium]|nr:HNH endonuclease signature motif containing protein [Streptosporangiaceae bacterium]
MTAAAAAAAACDSQIAPLVAGHVDHAALQAMRGLFLSAYGLDPDGSAAGGCGCSCGGCTCPARRPLPADTLARLDRALLAMAADVLSGPGGLASWLRAALAGDPACPAGAAAPSLPLDISLPLDSGRATERVPAHLRRAVALRDLHCRFPGCRARPAACQVHHVIPRSRGGPTRLGSLILLCSFHHLIAIHRWGWQVALHADGSVTATSPDGQRTLYGHGPPPAA